LTAFSSASLAGLISDRQRSWDSPFGAFSSRRAPQHSCCADPRAVSSRLRHLRCRKRPRTTPRLLGFGPAPSPSRLGQTVRPDHRRKLLWASPLLGVSHRPACRDSRRNSSYVLSGSADGGHPGRMHLRVSIARRLPRPVAGPGPLLGSHTFPFPSVRAANNPGYVFTSPGRHHYWWPHRILGLSRLCRSRPDRTSVPGESRLHCRSYDLFLQPLAFRFYLLQQILPAVPLFPSFDGTFQDEVSFRLRCTFP
jgi:hypothetical protein